MAVLPFYLTFLPLDLLILRILRVARVFKILKYHRYTDSLDVIRKVCLEKFNQLMASVMLLGIVIIIASVLIYHVENAAQPGVFDNAFSAFWWIVATLINVSTGDVYPITFLGRIFSSLIAILGIGLIAVPTGIISAGFIEHINNKNKRNLKPLKTNFCPQCGPDFKAGLAPKQRGSS